MSRSVKWYVLLWVGVALVVAGCGAPVAVTPESLPISTTEPVVVASQSDPTLVPIPTPMLATPQPASSPPPAPVIVTRMAGPAWHHYWRASGKSLEVLDLAVDGEWLWIATPQGLVRVNQHTLAYEQFFHTDTLPDVPLDGLTTLLVDDQGRLWAGGQDGLVRYDDDAGWTAIYTAGQVHSFALDADGNIWTFFYSRGGGGAFRFQGQEPLAGGNWEPECITKVADWDDCGAWRFRATPWLKYDSPAECAVVAQRREQLSSLMLPEEIGPVSQPSAWLIAEDASGYCWFISRSSRDYSSQFLIHYDGETAQPIFWPHGHAHTIVAAGVKDGVWIGSEEGLFYSDGHTVQEYLFAAEMLVPRSPEVHSLAITSDGRVWASTSDGLFCFDEERGEWQPVAMGEKVAAGERALIAADPRGGLWAFYSGNLAHFDGQTWQYWSYPDVIPSCRWAPRAVGEFNGEVWVAAGDGGLWRFDGQAWGRSPLHFSITALTRGQDGNLYAQEKWGLIYRYDGINWSRLPDRRGYGNIGVSIAVAVDAEGSVWMASRTNNRRYPSDERKTDILRYSPAERWTNAPPLPGGFTVTALLMDATGNLWVGGASGLLRCHEQVCEVLNFGDDVGAGPFVTVLAEDRQGRIWVGGRGWLSVCDPAAER